MFMKNKGYFFHTIAASCTDCDYRSPAYTTLFVKSTCNWNSFLSYVSLQPAYRAPISTTSTMRRILLALQSHVAVIQSSGYNTSLISLTFVLIVRAVHESSSQACMADISRADPDNCNHVF